MIGYELVYPEGVDGRIEAWSTGGHHHHLLASATRDPDQTWTVRRMAADGSPTVARIGERLPWHRMLTLLHDYARDALRTPTAATGGAL